MKRLRFKLRNRFNSLSSYQKRIFGSLLVCLFFVFSLTVGYAYLSKNLDIKGEIYLRKDNDIHVNSIDDFQSSNEGYEKYNPSYSINSITTSIILPNIDSEVSYKATIVNNGALNMKIKSITPISSNDSIIYFLEGIDNNSVIASLDTVEFSIVFKYNVQVLPSKTDLDLVLNFEFEEYIVEEKDYVNGNMLLDLRGYDIPIDNTWYDRTTNKAMKLSNILYDKENKAYNFSNGGYGSLEMPLIPETGNFTLEALVILPNKFVSNDDQAILSQINDISGDKGRFKLNYAIKNNIPSLLTFANETSKTNTNSFYYFINNISPSKKYLMQLIRTDSTLELYINGIKTESKPFSIDNKISQGDLKIGMWNSADKQYYKGKISAVRLYDRILSDEELSKNYEVDKRLYMEEKEDVKVYNSIYEYAINNQVVSDGDGLYLDNNIYIYRGYDPNNYIKIGNSLYRIINMNSNYMKVIDITNYINEAYDKSGFRSSDTSSYCLYANKIADNKLNQFYGCNAWNQKSNVIKDASINDYLNSSYYNNLNNDLKKIIVKHDFNIGIIAEGISFSEAITQSKTDVWNGYIGMVTVDDILNSGFVSINNVTASQTSYKSYLVSLSSNTKAIWSMNAASNNTFDVWSIFNGGNVGKRRASRYYQEINSSTIMTFYALPSFYISSTYNYTGAGTIDDPFVIKVNE